LAGRHRTFEHKRRKSVQRVNGSFEHCVLPQPLPQAAKDILGVLGADGVAGEAAIVANVVKSDVSYWVKRFVKASALVLRESQDPETLGKPRKHQHVGPGLPKYYDLTPYGSKLLTGSEGCLRLPVVLEDHAVKFRVLRWERFGSIVWEKLGEPRNWRKFGFRVSGVRVVKTSRSVIVHPGSLKGFNVDALEVDAGRIVERVRYILEVRFGMQLADDCVHLHDPRWQVYRPECKKWVEAGTCEVKGVGGLDHSPKPSKHGVRDPLSNEPHVEYSNKRHAAIAAAFPVASDPAKRLATAASAFPLTLESIDAKLTVLLENIEPRLDDIESKINALVTVVEKTVERLVVSVDKLSDALGKIFNLEESQDGRSNQNGQRRFDYVS
jgi:hypothetical protein